MVFETIEDVLAGRPGRDDASSLLAVPRRLPAVPKAPAPAVVPARASPTPEEVNEAAAEFQARVRHTFIANARSTCTEVRRLFQAFATAQKEPERHLRLQDGGELTEHVLAGMGPEVWDDFQTKFLDAPK